MATTTTNNGWTIPQSTDLVSAGATAIATLGSGIDTSVGTGLLAWTSYTPTLTNITKGTGATESYYYCKIGKTVHVRGYITLGTGGSVTGTTPRFSLPFTAATDVLTNGVPLGFAQFSDASAAVDNFGYGYLVTTSAVGLIVFNAAATYLSYTAVSATVPFTWTVSDRLRFQFTYEAA